MAFDEVRTKENQLRNYEDKLMQVPECITSETDIERFDSILEKLQEEQKQWLDEKGFLNGVDKTYQRFLSQLQSNKKQHDSDDHHSCPVCMRFFKDQQELEDTIKELKRYTAKLPQKMTDLDAKLKSVNSRVEKMINLKPIKETYENLKSRELSSVKSQLENLDRAELPKLREEARKCQESLKALEEKRACSEQLQNEIFLIDRYANESRELEKKIQIALNTFRLWFK